MKKMLMVFVLAFASLQVQAQPDSYATCIGCHGAGGEGGVGPQLDGQTSENIVEKLNKYRAGEQVGPMTAMMAPMAASLTDEQIKELGDYLSSL